MTCNVTCLIEGQNEAPIRGATVTAMLTGVIVGDALVMPTHQTQITDSHGRCTLALTPNGTTGTTYTFAIALPGVASPQYFHGITVPDVVETSLAVLLGGQPETRGVLMVDGASVLVDGFPIIFS